MSRKLSKRRRRQQKQQRKSRAAGTRSSNECRRPELWTRVLDGERPEAKLGPGFSTGARARLAELDACSSTSGSAAAGAPHQIIDVRSGAAEPETMSSTASAAGRSSEPGSSAEKTASPSKRKFLGALGTFAISFMGSLLANAVTGASSFWTWIRPRQGRDVRIRVGLVHGIRGGGTPRIINLSARISSPAL